MKTICSLSLSLIFILMGCTSNRIVRPTTSADYAALNEQGLRREAIVTLVNGQKLVAEKSRFSPDSTSWVDPGTRKVVAVPTTEVSDIRFILRGKGALQGLGFGLAGGAITGVALSFATGDDAFFRAEEKAILVGIFLGGLGGLVGIPVGAIVGSKEVYRIEQDLIHNREIEQSFK